MTVRREDVEICTQVSAQRFQGMNSRRKTSDPRVMILNVKWSVAQSSIFPLTFLLIFQSILHVQPSFSLPHPPAPPAGCACFQASNNVEFLQCAPGQTLGLFQLGRAQNTFSRAFHVASRSEAKIPKIKCLFLTWGGLTSPDISSTLWSSYSFNYTLI